MFCQKCGADLGNPQGDMRFCSRCGAPLRRPATNTVPPGGYYRPVQTAENGTADIAAKLKDGLDSITSKINDLTGEGGEVELRLKDLVVDVFKKHTRRRSGTPSSSAALAPPRRMNRGSWPSGRGPGSIPAYLPFF